MRLAVVLLVATTLLASSSWCASAREVVLMMDEKQGESEAKFARDKRTLDEQQASTIPAANPNFEAAFQGKCGDQRARPSSAGAHSNGNPCEHVCLDLHDGTYECACFLGFTLAVDGYSCTRSPQQRGPSVAEFAVEPAKAKRNNSTSNENLVESNPIQRRSSQQMQETQMSSLVVAPEAKRRLEAVSLEFLSPQQRQRPAEGNSPLLDQQNDNKRQSLGAQKEPDSSQDDDDDQQDNDDKRQRKLASANLMGARGTAPSRLANVSSAKHRMQVELGQRSPSLPVSGQTTTTSKKKRKKKSQSGASKEIKELQGLDEEPLDDDGRRSDALQSFDYQEDDWWRRQSDQRDVQSIKLANDRLIESLQETVVGGDQEEGLKETGRTNETDSQQNGNNPKINNNNNNNNSHGSESHKDNRRGVGRREKQLLGATVMTRDAKQIRSGVEDVGGRRRRREGGDDGQKDDEAQSKQNEFDYDLSLLEALINKTINDRSREGPPSRVDYNGQEDDHDDDDEEINEAAASGLGQANRSFRDERPEDQTVSFGGARWPERRSMGNNGADNKFDEDGEDEEDADNEQQPADNEPKPSNKGNRVGPAASNKQVPITSATSSSDATTTTTTTTTNVMMARNRKRVAVNNQQTNTDGSHDSKSDDERRKTSHSTITSCLEMAECESGGECIEQQSSDGRTRARCRCPIGRGGDSCQRPIQRNVPKFSGLSYLALPMTSDQQLAYLRFDFKPEQNVANQASILLSTSRFALVMDSTNRVELRYLQLSNHINASREQLTRVIGSRDAQSNEWNQLVITDASSDQTLEITEDSNDDDRGDGENDEDADEDTINERQKRVNKIVLVMPDKIHLEEYNIEGHRGRKHHDDANTQLFVGGLPEPVLVNYKPSESDNHDNLIRNDNARMVYNNFDQDDKTRRLILDDQSTVFGFTGCISLLQVNGRSYNMRSDLNGDALDGFDLGECN